MKKRTLIGALLLLVAVLAVGCGAGVSQEEYDQVTSDLTVAQARIAELEAVQTGYQDFKADLTSSWSSLDAKLELGAYIIRYWAAGAVGDEQKVAQMTLSMTKYVDAVENDELSQIWQDAMSYAMQEQQPEFMEKFALLMTKTVELFNQDTEALEALVAE